MKKKLIIQKAAGLFGAVLTLVAALSLTACDSFLDITPTGRVIAKTGEEYRNLLTYEYKYFPKDRYMTILRTDEVSMDKKKSNASDLEYYLDFWRWKDEDPSPVTSYPDSWRRYYHTIYIANYIIEHQHEITNATRDEVQQLVGESYMMRAYAHFLLVNLYAEPYTHCDPQTTRGVPMQLVADVNAIPGSSSVGAIYAQVLSDIDEAEKLLNVDTWEVGENYRFSTLCVPALRARVYLYMGNWQAAFEAAKAVLDKKSDLADLTLSTVTLPNTYTSSECILALEKAPSNIWTAINMVNPDFVSLYRTGDQRRTKFYKRPSSSTYSLQKGGSDDFSSSFRTSEAYLTAAECAARLGQTSEAVETYLMPLLRKRLNSDALSTTTDLMAEMTQEQLVQEILDERARELSFEGHRWYDLRRTTRPALTRLYDGETYTLTPEKYTLRFPTDAVEANPEIERWNTSEK